MRKLIAVLGLATLVLLLGNVALLSQQQFTQEQLDAWQAIAETYYTPGVDEDFMLGDPTLLPNAWGYDKPDMVVPGMIAPDFTLMGFYGEVVSLSQFNGQKFVVMITGSWY